MRRTEKDTTEIHGFASFVFATGIASIIFILNMLV